MNVGGVRWGRPPAAAVRVMLEAARRAEPTYDQVGSTLGAASGGQGGRRARGTTAPAGPDGGRERGGGARGDRNRRGSAAPTAGQRRRATTTVPYSRSAEVGQGPAAFRWARAALAAWVPQRAVGAEVVPAGQPVEAGATVVLVIGRGPFHVVAPARVVTVVDEPGRFAYAYGTLPGHPMVGEESFVVELLPGGTVRLTIRVQAPPATQVGRLVGPVVSRLQRAALGRYLKAVAGHVRAG